MSNKQGFNMRRRRETPKMEYFYGKCNLYFLSLIFAVFQVSCLNNPAKAEEGVLRYKMVSTVEYNGDGQFRNQAETFYTVKKEPLENDKIRYSVATEVPNSDLQQHYSSLTFSFVIDQNTQQVSAVKRDISFWAKVHNETVKSLRKVSQDYVGKTWKQTIDLSSLHSVLPDELRYTLTAIHLRTNAAGDMIAVRAMSEPFFVKIEKGSFRTKINTIYLFDSKIEDIYLNISVFEAATDVRGFNEILRNEVATYKIDNKGVPVDLSDVGQDFERLVARIGLSKSGLKIVKETELPKWAYSKGLKAAQVSNICSSAVCEGALNPVTMISMPTAEILELQRQNALRGIPIYQRLVSGFGWNLPTAGFVGAAIAGGVILSDDDDDHDVASPH
jgi:hypothetical protein